MSDVKVILDVEIGHGICPEDETEETCKLNKVSEAIQQELLKARIDELGKFSNGLQMRHYETDIYIDDRIADLQKELKEMNDE